MVGMMWFKREPKPVAEKSVENGVVGKLRRKKAVLLKPTRESSERETSTESDKERRRYSDILDIKVSLERRDESDESLYESADCQSDAISASDDALPRLSRTPTMSKESLKLVITDEEVDARSKRGHRKTMSLSNPLEMVKSLGDEWFDHTKKDLDKNFDKKKSRESLWSEEDRESIHGSTLKLDQIRNGSKKDDKSNPASRKGSSTDISKPRKGSKSSSVSALNFLRRKKAPTASKSVEAVMEIADRISTTEEILNYTKFFLEEEKRHSSLCGSKPLVETDSDDDSRPPKLVGEHRRRLSRQTSRSKSKVRGKSQSLKVNTLRKSHSGTLKKGKKKSVKTPSAGRSRQASIVDPPPLPKKSGSDTSKQHSWLFSASTYRGESRREGSTEEPSAPEPDLDSVDITAKEQPDWRAGGGGRPVNRAESCRERDAPRRGKHRNASDPNRLTAHHTHDLEPGTATAPSGSSSSSSLSSRSNESNTVAAEQQASHSDWSEEDEPLAAQWADNLPPQVLDSLLLSARLRKRQEVIHELIVSEGSHVRWLKVLDGVFHRPLLNQPSLLPSEDLKALFPNLPGVRERHAKLYTELRTARNEAPNHIVQIRPVAEALLTTLGDSGYAACLSRFCRGQRMALDALRERRRKHKELHQFLSSREQLPLCGRLQLRDLLACVWQRLTKYQLLLEGVLKTVSEAEGDSAEDTAAVRRALAVAKDVLHSVDTAIRTAENEHRLRTIQTKLEVRAGAGPEWDELRRLDLTTRSLRHEGELGLRNDSTKRVAVLALMLEDCLVLLQREGDKFVLKPINQPSQQGLLSPLIKWDKVIFRPNAAVRNTFFLMNINGVQMHELSANTSSEYATWVKHIKEAPLAKLTELKPIAPATAASHHQHSRSNDDSGINVSRNPSDASEKSSSTTADEEREHEHAVDHAGEHVAERDRSSTERNEQEKEEREAEKRDEVIKDRDSDDSHRERRATVGRISTHCEQAGPALAPRGALTVRAPPAHVLTATRALTHHERLRRLDEVISRALRAKSGVVAELLGVPPESYSQVAEMAVADTLGQVDMSGSGIEPTESDSTADIHQLLLAAHAQASQLTEMLSKALTIDETSAIAARSGRCDNCRYVPRRTHENVDTSVDRSDDISDLENCLRSSDDLLDGSLDDASYDLLADVSPVQGTNVRDCIEPIFGGAGGVVGECELGAALLARRLVAPAGGLSAALARLLGVLPPQLQLAGAARAQLARERDRADALRHAHAARTDYQMTEEISFPKGVDQSLQDQPSNGG